MIVLDEQICRPWMQQAIKRWYKGAVMYITDVRPHTLILDDVMPVLLRELRQPTFVTINHSDFWHKLLANDAYCAICFKLSEERVRELPEMLRDVLRMPEWKTKRQRMGKVLLVSEQSLRWY